MWPTPCGTDTMRPVFIREAAHCVLYSSGLFSCGRRVGTSHFLSSSNSPGGRPSLACPPTPRRPCRPSQPADHCAREASFLSFLGPVACVCLALPGTRSCPCCRLSDLRFQPRMQADKCRTSSRSVKKELVIESPLQRKDAAPGEVEAESPGPVLVRGVVCCLLHRVLFPWVRTHCLLALWF